MTVKADIAISPSLAVGIATAAVTLLVASHLLVVGSVEGRWVFPYLQPYRPAAFLVTALAVAGAVLLVRGCLDLAAARPALAVVLAVAGATLLQLLLWRVYPFTPGSIVRSDNATSYFTAALRYEPSVLLLHYDVLAPTLPLHAVGNMPGKILLFRAFHAVTSSPDVMAVLVLLLSNLVGAVVFAIARELLDDPEAAFGALALYLFLPSRLVFAPSLNGVVPLPAALALLAWVRFLRTGSPWAAAANGLAVLAMLLLDPTPLALGLVFVGAAVAGGAAGRYGLRRVGTGVAVAVAALVVGVVAVREATGFDLVRQLARVAFEADGFNAWAGRGYVTWLVPNLVEFVVAVGVPVAVTTAFALARGRPRAEPAWWLAATAVLSLVVLDLLGRNRGEVSRLWIFLSVPFVLAAAAELGRAPRRELLQAVGWLVVQGATMLAVLGFLVP